MRRSLSPAAAAAALSLFATAAFATAPTFEDVDLDGNGIVTPAEFANAMPDASDEDFALIDADSDGTISEDEMTAATDVLETPKG